MSPTFMTPKMYIRAYIAPSLPIGTMIYYHEGMNTSGWLAMDGETLHTIMDYQDLWWCLLPIHMVGQKIFETYDETHFVLAGFNRPYRTWDTPGA